jgi:hypothetical protein
MLAAAALDHAVDDGLGNGEPVHGCWRYGREEMICW